jgi:hypothetical protein
MASIHVFKELNINARGSAKQQRLQRELIPQEVAGIRRRHGYAGRWRDHSNHMRPPSRFRLARYSLLPRSFDSLLIKVHARHFNAPDPKERRWIA